MAETINIKLESVMTDAEFYAKLKKTDKVKDLIEIVKKNWGTEPFTLHFGNYRLETEKTLASYKIKEGSIVKVKYYADEDDIPPKQH